MWTEILLGVSLWMWIGSVCLAYCAIKAATKGEYVKEGHTIPFIITFTVMGPMIFVIALFLKAPRS